MRMCSANQEMLQSKHWMDPRHLCWWQGLFSNPTESILCFIDLYSHTGHQERFYLHSHECWLDITVTASPVSLNHKKKPFNLRSQESFSSFFCLLCVRGIGAQVWKNSRSQVKCVVTAMRAAVKPETASYLWLPEGTFHPGGLSTTLVSWTFPGGTRPATRSWLWYSNRI